MGSKAPGQPEGQSYLTSTGTSATAATGTAAGLVGGLSPVGTGSYSSITESCATKNVNLIVLDLNLGLGYSIPFSLALKPPRGPEREPVAASDLTGAVPSALAFPVLVDVLVTGVRGAAGVSDPSIVLPKGHDRVNRRWVWWWGLGRCGTEVREKGWACLPRTSKGFCCCQRSASIYYCSPSNARWERLWELSDIDEQCCS